MSECKTDCLRCARKGIAILPVIYAVAPKEATAALTPLKTSKYLGTGVIDKALSESNYILRTLPAGYLYILTAKKVWRGYQVDSQGGLQYYPNLANEDMPDAPLAKTVAQACKRQAKNVANQVLAIEGDDPVWIAFSRHKWSKAVRSDHQKAPDARMTLVEKLDGSEFAHGIAATRDNIEKYVANFNAKAVAAINAHHPEDAALVDRSAQFSSLPQSMTALSVGAKKPNGLIVALADTVGMIEQLNRHRQMALTEQVLFQSHPGTAWKKLSSDCIVALRQRMQARKKAELVQKTTGKPLSEKNNPSHLPRSRELVYRQQYDAWIKSKSLPAGARFTPAGGTNSNVGRVEVPTDYKAAQATASDFERIEAHYSEADRKRFADDYTAQIKRFGELIVKRDQDYSTWMDAKSAKATPNLFDLCALDFTESDPDRAADYIRTVSAALAGGPMSTSSLACFTQLLKRKVDDPHQIALRALTGNIQSLGKFLNEDKRDKVYDSIKGALTADDLKLNKWLTPALAAYANPILAAVGATAFAVQKDGTIDKALRAHIKQIVCVTLALWERVEVATVKLRMRISDLQQAALAAGFAPSLAKGTASASQRIPARLRLPKAIGDKTIDAVFWTTDKLDDFLKQLPKAPANPEKAAAAWVEAANDCVQSSFRGLRRAIEPGQSRDIAQRILKRTDTVMGGPGLLAAGALILQTGQFIDNLDKAQQAGGSTQMDGLLGLGDAVASLLAAGVELGQELHKARQIANKASYNKRVLVVCGRVAAGFGAIGSAFNSVQSFGAASRGYSSGDYDSMLLHGTAGAAFFGATAAGVAIALFGAKATFLGAALGLGPAGWAVLFTVAAVGLTYAALNAEDTDAEIFVARNTHWSISKRTDPKFADWQQEAEAFTALWYGIKAELNWGDTLSGTLGVGLDELKVDITIAESDPAEGWRYRLFVQFPKGEGEIYNEASGVPKFPSIYAGNKPEFRALDPKIKTYSEGRDFKLHGIRIERTDGIQHVEHTYELNDAEFQRARLEFEYYPDASNLNEKTRIEIRRTDAE